LYILPTPLKSLYAILTKDARGILYFLQFFNNLIGGATLASCQLEMVALKYSL
jgi:hypothetical protein